MTTCVRVRLASEVYAMPVSYVLEVTPFRELVPVPGARPEILGIHSLRGQILPVVDLAALLGLQRTAAAGHLLVAAEEDRRAAFTIDEMADVVELGEPTEETQSSLLLGAVLTPTDLIGVINVPKVFNILERPS
jgi:chemotaxis signal transduction protein